MKKALILFPCWALFFFTALSQGVGINAGNTPAHPSAMLDVESNRKGILIPRMSAQDRLAIVSPATGLLVFDNDSSSLFMFTGTWKSIKKITFLSELIRGNAVGDMLKWDGVQWVLTQSQISQQVTYYYRDSDGDGFGDKYHPVVSPEPFPGFITDSTDCDDTNVNINPNGVLKWYLDKDKDGYTPSLGSTVTGCKPNDDYISENAVNHLIIDCNDNNANIHPGAVELCGNGVDDNCDGLIDQGGLCDVNNTADEDADGVSSQQGDCNDHNAAIRPGAIEIPGNGIDENCDGMDMVCDDNNACTTDMVVDGVCIHVNKAAGTVCDDGNPATVSVCDGNGNCMVVPDSDNDGYTVEQGDCNDNNANIHPGAVELCGNGVDDNCDGLIDQGGLCDVNNTADEDADGVSSQQGDCNDHNAAIRPGAIEIPGNGIDENCDGMDMVCDDNNACTTDMVVDGVCIHVNKAAGTVCDDGNPATVSVCDGNGNCMVVPDSDHDGYTVEQGDCNDNNANIHPGAVELCGNGVDDNCDGLIDLGGGTCPDAISGNKVNTKTQLRKTRPTGSRNSLPAFKKGN